MSKLSDEFSLEQPLERAANACRTAVAALGWRMHSSTTHGLVAKIDYGGFNWPGQIAMVFSPVSPSETRITLDGKIGGIGPIQKSHLHKQMERFQDAARLASRQT